MAEEDGISGGQSAGSDDAVLDALDRVLAVGRSNVTAWMSAMERIEQVRRLRKDGCAYTRMQLPTDLPLIDALAENQARLTDATAELRDGLIVQLRREGLSIAEIARRFHVSRQWVSGLLKDLGGATQSDSDGVEKLDESGC